MTDAYIAGLTFGIGDGGAPENFNTLEEVISLGAVSKTNDTIEVTSFDSNKVKEYIGGLADGSEFSAECNHIVDPAQNVQQLAVIAYIEAKTTFNIKITLTDGTDSINLDFAVVPVSYGITPAVSEAAKIAFNFKITGDITFS